MKRKKAKVYGLRVRLLPMGLIMKKIQTKGAGPLNMLKNGRENTRQ